MSILAAPAAGQAMARTTETVICIGASTGGTESLRVVLEALPAASPGIVIVQHMPEKFTEAFARRLDSAVRDGGQGSRRRRHGVARPRADRAGRPHMLLQRSGARYYVSVKDGPLGVAPSAVGRRAVPIGRALCRGKRARHHHDRDGR